MTNTGKRFLGLGILGLLSACIFAGAQGSGVEPSQSPLTSQQTAPENSVGQGSGLEGCPVFPPDHIWNWPVDTLPLDPHSADYITSMNPAAGVHPDFGNEWDGSIIGIPYNVVPGSQPGVEVTFDYADESDPGLYPIPPGAIIEGGPDAAGDRHVLVLDRDRCILYELYHAFPEPGGSWTAGSGAIFDLSSYTLRPAGWTSADAAGLPILPGLVRYDEVVSGKIEHAIRFTTQETQRLYVWPARHFASDSTDPALPPMGQRFRLRSSFDTSSFSPSTRVILEAMKTYGVILADNGSNWYISGTYDPRWEANDMLDTLVTELRQVHGSDFEAVDVSSLMLSPDSGQVWVPANLSPRSYLPLVNRQMGNWLLGN